MFRQTTHHELTNIRAYTTITWHCIHTALKSVIEGITFTLRSINVVTPAKFDLLAIMQNILYVSPLLKENVYQNVFLDIIMFSLVYFFIDSN